MADKVPEALTESEGPPSDAGLSQPILDELGEGLRRAAIERAPAPAYLGDRGLPPELEHQLVELESAVDIHEKGVDAVSKALGIDDSEADPDANEIPPAQQPR